jgi:hyaluronate lyase
VVIDIHPYHGGYGKNLFKGLADIIYLLHGSAWELKDNRVNHIYEWAVKSFMPIVWRGALFANLRGREISRQDGTDYHAADDVITAMIRLIHISNDPQLVSTLKSWVKYNVVNARPWHDYLDTASGSLYRAATDIINDPLVNEQGDLNEAVWMRNADRGFLLRPGYAFTLGMSSNRIAAYECLNGGNLKGWYTGAGMTLVYNDDLGQYNDGYWATADMYHVPGTTASTNERTPCSGSRSVSREGWTTGSNTGVHASIGMRYRSWGGITNATKSWFFLDNEIVCLGAGITSHGITHTTIDQRQFLTQRHISLDNINMTQESTFEKTIDAKSVYTIRLESNVDEASDLAYYVHEVTDPIIVSKRDLTGSWIDVNNGHVIQDNTPFQRKYASIVIDHGNSPVNASYVYSIRPKPELIPPGASFQVLANSEDVQAVQSADKRVIGAVFYAGGEVSGIFAADSSCAITVTLVTQGTVRVAVELPDVNAAADIRLMNLANYTLPNPVVGARITALGSGGLGLIVTNPIVTFDLISA